MAENLGEIVARRLAGTLEALAIEKGVAVDAVRDAAVEYLIDLGAEDDAPDTVASVSDARTVNNTTRQRYRVLSELEKAQCDGLRELGAMFIGLLHEIGGTDPDDTRMASRDLSLALTHMEDAVMRAVRHVTA